MSVLSVAVRVGCVTVEILIVLDLSHSHSDSMDPSSYKNPPGPLLNPNMTAEEMNAWAYVRVPGTGILPGLFCPHYDVRASQNLLLVDIVI